MITIKPRPPVVLPTPSENREIMFRDHDDKIKIKNRGSPNRGPTPVMNLMSELQKAQDNLHEILAGIEDQLTKISPYPATLPIYEWHGRDTSSGRRSKTPVAYLHFEAGDLSFSQVPRPYVPAATCCSRCRTPCKTCMEQNKAARKRWDAREALKATRVDVLEVDDGGILGGIIQALPAMKKRLESDSKVTPEAIEKAVQAGRRFLSELHLE